MTRYRFVGGPWHNRHVECAALIVVTVTETIEKRKWPSGVVMLQHRYHLYRFKTPTGAIFDQYVHESRIRNGGPLPEEEEQFPGFELELSR